ncbi:hypothetical protein [Parabacteroides sp. PF5-6]|uniref:ABC transporter permease n=1 Tax=Parabacteroides sp. PF5-6 TaxID=1742403 RepID=UPI002404C02D|nr:hypothetical protein [Parabacteroides sp. PF5-6]MDF9829411.1 ABC-type antimicrobial peptide transport system permease subunit [Parabacteroides sp. PF5-6]
MIRQYLKQAWQLLKQNRFYTGIYILATAFSIALVMVLAIVFYIKIANVYPETWLILALMVVLAVWYPARSASRMKPVEALRDE